MPFDLPVAFLLLGQQCKSAADERDERDRGDDGEVGRYGAKDKQPGAVARYQQIDGQKHDGEHCGDHKDVVAAAFHQDFTSICLNARIPKASIPAK